MPFADCVRSGEIHAQVITHHESDIWQPQILPCNAGDPDGGPHARLEQLKLTAKFIKNADPHHFGTPIAESVIHVGYAFEKFRWSLVDSLTCGIGGRRR